MARFCLGSYIFICGKRAPSSGVRSPLRSGGSRRVSLKELGAWFPGFLTPAPTPAVFRGRQGGQRLEGATAHRTLCPNQGLTARLFSGRGRRRSRGRRPGNVTRRLSEGCTEHTGHASERGGKVWNPNRPEAHLQKKSELETCFFFKNETHFFHQESMFLARSVRLRNTCPSQTVFVLRQS